MDSHGALRGRFCVVRADKKAEAEELLCQLKAAEVRMHRTSRTEFDRAAAEYQVVNEMLQMQVMPSRRKLDAALAEMTDVVE